jgi:hypothetical protein
VPLAAVALLQLVYVQVTTLLEPEGLSSVKTGSQRSWRASRERRQRNQSTCSVVLWTTASRAQMRTLLFYSCGRR